MTQTENAVVKQPEKLKSLLQDPMIRGRFEQMLGQRAPAFLSSIISAVSANPQLSDCDPMSVIQSAAVAASMDLPINSSLGMAHIVPYGKIAQFQIGWKGFVQLAQRTGQYKTINLALVLDGQLVSRNSFTGEMIFQEAATSKKVVGYLLYFKLINGFEKYFYMTAEEMKEHALEYSKAYKKNFGPWVDNPEAMGLKTVCKLGLSKYGLLSVDMQKALEVDQAAFDEKGEPRYVDAEPRTETPPPETKTEKLNREESAKTGATIVKPKDSAPAETPATEQGAFQQFAEPTSIFAKKETITEETINDVQGQIIDLQTKLGFSDAKFLMHVSDMFGNVKPEQLTLEQCQKFRDDYLKKLEQGKAK